jgi:hypothetical protein
MELEKCLKRVLLYTVSDLMGKKLSGSHFLQGGILRRSEGCKFGSHANWFTILLASFASAAPRQNVIPNAPTQVSGPARKTGPWSRRYAGMRELSAPCQIHPSPVSDP